MEGEWSCYKDSQLMEGACSCYIGGQFNGERMVILRRWPVYWRENGHVTKVGSLKEGKWSYYRGGQWWRENGHVMEAASLMEEE